MILKAHVNAAASGIKWRYSRRRPRRVTAGGRRRHCAVYQHHAAKIAHIIESRCSLPFLQYRGCYRASYRPSGVVIAWRY
ncbi:hypothetical protein KCP71_11235 [Salmonella enterica subsp. enterica]|nr:hypothetical protein KCP71_11235 [Salmonella enterica subsp. enterica]